MDGQDFYASLDTDEASAPTAEALPEPAADILATSPRHPPSHWRAEPHLRLAPPAERLIVTIPAGMPAWTVVGQVNGVATRRIIVSVKSAGQLLDVCPRTVYAWLRAGRIEGCYTPSGLRRIYVDTLFATQENLTDRDQRGGYQPATSKRTKAGRPPASLGRTPSADPAPPEE